MDGRVSGITRLPTRGPHLGEPLDRPETLGATCFDTRLTMCSTTRGKSRIET